MNPHGLSTFGSMKKLEWSPRLNLGIKQIDDQHKRLVKLTNNLMSAIQSGVADDLLVGFCMELVEYTEFHFRDEEMLMREVGYPHIDEHSTAHRTLEGKVREYHEAVSKGRHVSSAEVLEFLGSWLVDHIIYTDMKISEYIGKEQPLEETEE